jgi:hypothetical protein
MDDETLSTAYHEAGHAVIAVYLRVTIDRITVKPDMDMERLGHVSGDLAGLTTLKWRAISTAGVFAEAMHAGGFEAGGDPFAALERGRGKVSGYERDLEALPELKSFDDNFVEFVVELLEFKWEQIVRVVTELEKHETLEGDDLARVLPPRVPPRKRRRKKRKLTVTSRSAGDAL